MWVPLHVHSQYSILDATASVQDIAKQTAALGIQAVALTDHSNLFGAIDFYKECKQSKVSPIIGCEMYVAPGMRQEKKKEGFTRSSFNLVLLAKNMEGYHNLCKLSSIGYLEGFYYNPRIDHDVLTSHAKGLICISGGLNSRVAHEVLYGTEKSLLEMIQWHQELFGEDYYLELQRHTMSQQNIQIDGIQQESWLYQQYEKHIQNQEKVNQALIRIGKDLGISVVATNDSHYMQRNDWKAHEILINVQSGEACEIWEKDSLGQPKHKIPNPKRETYPSHEYYFKSPEQMLALFSDVPESISNTLKVAEKCHVEIDFKTKHYPIFIPPELEGKNFNKEEQVKSVETYLWGLCEQGINKRYNPERLAKIKEIYPDKEPMSVVRERLNYEMSIIAPKGMCDYLLIVWDFINWAKKNGIPMGPGRGSGVGSIILYLIGITDIEPLRFHLFFERFINPDRLSYPDIDVDICMDRRGEVINYTLQKYGKDNIAQIITFGTMKAKMSIKDVGRVLSIPLAKVNEITKLIPDDLNITLDKALEQDMDLRATYERDEEAHRLIDIARQLEGTIRNTGIHAAGIIISGEPLTNYIPICNAKDSDMPVTQYSMKPVELVGMLKVDFLGLKTLTAIQLCVDAIAANTGKKIDWIDLPLDDLVTFNLLNQGKTLGVFQLESGGMQDLARQLHLDKFEEIIAVGALYRPGPMDMIPSFINRKHEREPIEYDHPWMKEILSETYGIMVYQEQVMQIASKLALYSLGEGDVLRRAMGKKDLIQMAKEREKFQEGALKNGISAQVATCVFDKMEKFASYGFNKSHAAAYAYLSYVTAFFKANYPGEWMAALMTCDSADVSKIAKFIMEGRSLKVDILSPDVNESDGVFVATPKGIRFAMSGIKGVGTGVVEAIVEERKAKGRFKSLYDFCKRIDTKKVGKKAIENLIEAGCFDFTTWGRDALQQSVEPMFEASVKEQKEKSAGIMNFFDLMGDSSEERFSKQPVVKHPRSKLELQLKEKELLGLFLTGHPLNAYQEILRRLSCVPLYQIDEVSTEAVYRCAFIVESCQIRISAKNQRKFAILNVGDGVERYELPIWSELYEEKHQLLKENQLLYAVIHIERKEGAIRLNCKWLDDLVCANEAMILACDQAFDKAKHQSNKFASMGKSSPKKTSTQPKEAVAKLMKEEPKSIFSLNVDADQLKFSHLLQIKEVFTKHRGTTPVEMHFHAENSKLATLHINAQWGVKVGDSLTLDLKEITGIRSFS